MRRRSQYHHLSCQLAVIFISAIAILCASVIAVYVSNSIRLADKNVNEIHIAADYLASMIGAFVLALSIMVFPIKWSEKSMLSVLWATKALLVLLFMPLYQAHYAALDSAQYFLHGALEFRATDLPGFGQGTEVNTYCVHIISLILPIYFHLFQMVWSFFGLIAILLFYITFRLVFIDIKPYLLLVIGLFPGILFWSSIMGKDPIVLLGIALYAYGVASWSNKGSFVGLVVAALGVLLASVFRPWLSMILAAPMVIFPLRQNIPMWQKLALGGFVMAGVIGAISVFFQEFNITGTNNLVHTASQLGQGWEHGGSAQNIGDGFSSLGSMIFFAPVGMLTALFRPLPGEVHNLFGMLAGVSNLVLVYFTILASLRTNKRTMLSKNVIWMLAIILVWGLLYGFVSYQNLGTASRFKLQVLPILWPLVFVLSKSKTRAQDIN